MVLAKMLETETMGLILMLLRQLVVFIPFIDSISSFAQPSVAHGICEEFHTDSPPKTPQVSQPS